MGDIDPQELGKTDVHEHLLMRSPLRSEELDDLEKSTQEAVELREAGIDALVELTTIGLGREPQGVADIAARSGLHVVLATGVHREARYRPERYDGMSRVKYWPDSVLLDCLLQVATLGAAARRRRRPAFRSYGGLPGTAYLPRRFVPRLAEMGGEDLVRRIMVDNPARFLGFTPPEGA